QRPPKHGRAQADTPRREGRDVRASVDADDRSLPRPPQTPGGQRSGTNSEVDDSSRLRHDARGGRVEYLLVPGDVGTDAAVVLGQPDAEMRGDAHRLHGTMPAGAWRCPRLPSGANTGCRTRRNDTCGATRPFALRTNGWMGTLLRRSADLHEDHACTVRGVDGHAARPGARALGRAAHPVQSARQGTRSA